jgi:hypothetical protein
MKPSNSLGCLVARRFHTFLLVTAAALIFDVSSPRAIAAPVLVEFMASNDSSLYDEDGQSSDWIEIFNPDPTSADISGWFLTNDPTELDKWELPAGIVLPSGGSLIVFASNKDRDVGELHTNFKLSKEPEGYLALVEGDGQTVANGYIDYPEQFDDISYGLAQTGSGSDVTIIPENSISRILVPTSNIGTTWQDRLFDDSSWPSANTGIGYDYGNLIGSNGDVQSQTDDINGTVYVRVPFTIDDPENLTALTLRMKYDDGFAAYINGALVASAGAPASPQWNSVATEDHPDSAAVVFEDFNIPIGPNLLETGGNILAIHGLNRSTGSSDLLVLPRLDATTAATNPGLGEAGYFQNSTPATSNGTNQGLPAGAVTFSVPGRGFTNSVSLELSVASPNADIRYTTNGNVPNASSTRYTGNPISITSSQIIRARAYSNGLAPGPVSEEGYIELSSSAESFSSDIPVVIMERFSGGPTASNGKAYVFFAFFEPDPATGITRLNKPYSLGTRGGYKTRGSSSSGFEKKAYSIEAWNENNRNKDISPFGMPEESDWILNARSQFDRSLMRNAFIYNLSNQTGRYAMRTRFVELFLNTNGGSLSYGTRSSADYDGVYTFMEKISRDQERVDVERLPDSVSTEPGITGGYIMKIDRLDPGDSGLSAGGRSLGWVYPKEEDVTSAQATWLRNHLNEMTSSLSSGNYEEYIDPLAWVDHHLLNVLALNADALRLSTYFHKKRSGKVEFGPIWDFDRSMDSTDSRDDNPRSWSGGTNYFTYAWWNQLFGNEEFWQLYIDRYFELRKDVWTNENVQKIIADYAAELNQAQVRNFQRFSSQPRFGGYAGEVEHLRDWLTTRLNWMDGQFVPEPTANLNGGTFPAGTTLSLSGNLSNGRSIWYTLNGTDPRFTSNTTVLNTKTLVDITAPAKALVPTSNIGTNWRGGNEPFDDSSWIGGTNGIGFDSASTYNPYININLEAPNPVMSGVNTSAYVRIPFNVAAGDIAKFNYLTLQMRYDDGFVAFLNGTRIASGNAPGSLNWNSSASQNNDDGIAVTFIDFGADAFVNALKSGENILAIHGLNGSSTSSDFLIQARLVAGEKQVDPGESGGIEYTGPITLTETARLFARISDPRGGSNPGSGVPVGTGWGAPLELEYLVDEIPADSTNLVIREIMFDPYDLGNSLDEDSNFEFIELENISETKISLSDASFTRGVTFDFSSGSVRSLSPGGKVLVVNDLSAFQKIYGEGRNSLIAGEFGGSLNNDGELLELRGEDSLIQSINFASSGTWPTRADNGRSLVLVELNAPSNGASWTASRSLLGSPGRSEPSTIEVPNIYVNEVITNGAADAIEIFNPNGTSIDLGGWWLTDDLGKPEKFKIPNDSIIPPNGFLVFNESDFNPDPEPDEDTTERRSFGLSSGGEEVFLLSATPSGERTDYVHGFTFGDSAAGFSFGRHVNSIGKISYPPLKATSFNASNDLPRTGPLVITEMMYHPANGSVEFIEIQNISISPVPLAGVQISGIGFAFGPTAPELIPGEIVLVVETDPATFRSIFNPPASVSVFGPYSGRLSNGGEKVSLRVPEANPVALEPDLMPSVDIADYNDSSPWPTSPDGTGTTLVRILPALYGSDPNSWLASLNPGGTPGFVNSAPPIDWRAAYFSEAELLNATISGPLADADFDGVSNLLEHIFGTDPRDASSIDLPTVSMVSDGEETYAEFSYRLRQGLTGFRIRIEASSDLAEWKNADGNFTIQSDLDNGDGTSTLTARDENSVGAQLGRYFRIRVN